MLAITKDEVTNSGGLIGAISYKAVEYLKTRFRPTRDLHYVSTHILRTIVHTNPHLDEYFSELLFRASLSIDSRELDFFEEAIYSENNDLVAKELWPQSVVFGIGSTISPGANPLIKFDEHTTTKGRFSLSCAELVSKYVANNDLSIYPNSIRQIIREVNSIDAYGKAHPQNLSNIIKTLHNVKFLFSKGTTSKDDIRDNLNDTWKRSLLDGMFTAVIYAIDNGIDLQSNPDEQKYFLMKSLNAYKDNSLHRNNPYFEEAYNWLASTYGEQDKVINNAILRDSSNKEILDTNGNTIPQLLLLSKVNFACIECWGESFTSFLMTHIWESEFQRQINFRILKNELQNSLDNKDNVDKRTIAGIFSKRTLNKIRMYRVLKNKYSGQYETIQSWCNPIIIFISSVSGLFDPQEAALNYVNKYNSYCGFIIVEDSYTGTKALFRTEGIPNDKWVDLVDLLQEVDKDCWYDPTINPNKPAKFIVNGTKAHQYVKKSGLDIDAFSNIVERVFLQNQHRNR